jgi:hypothetical protein
VHLLLVLLVLLLLLLLLVERGTQQERSLPDEVRLLLLLVLRQGNHLAPHLPLVPDRHRGSPQEPHTPPAGQVPPSAPCGDPQQVLPLPLSPLAPSTQPAVLLLALPPADVPP